MNPKELLILFSVVVFGQCSSIPDYIQVCGRDDPHIKECIINSVHNLLPKLRVGIPELHVPAVEPLTLTERRFNSRSGNTYFNVNLTNLVAYGGTEFKILDLVPKVDKNYFRFKVSHPHIYVTGDYVIDSRILILQLSGKGKLHLNLTDFTHESVLKGEVVTTNGEKHLKFEKITIKIGFGKGHILLENLFNGDPVLGKGANDAINDNIQVFFDELKPNFENSLAKRFTAIANRITGSFLYDDLFPATKRKS